MHKDYESDMRRPYSFNSKAEKQDEREKERQKKRAGICQMLVSGCPGHKRRHRESNRGNTGQFPVLPTKSESKLKDFFSMQIFFPFASDVSVLEDPLLNVLMFTVHCL